MRKAFLMAAVTAALLASAAYAGNGARTARSSVPSAAGTLTLHGVLKMTSVTVACPPEAPPDVRECRARTGEGLVPGLGRATEIYTYLYSVGPWRHTRRARALRRADAVRVVMTASRHAPPVGARDP